MIHSDRRTVYTDLRLFINRAKGITPTAVGWDTPPTDLPKATDEDFETSTGPGTTTIAAATRLGEIRLDFGRAYPVLFFAKLGMWRDAARIEVYMGYSVDGVTWYHIRGGMYDCLSFASTEEIVYTPVLFVKARYIRLYFYGTGAMTGNVKIYEIMALDIRLGDKG